MDGQSQNIKTLANGESQSAGTGFLSSDQRDILRIFLRNRLSVLGLGIVIFWLVVAIIGPALAPLPPQEMDIMNRRSPPNAAHPLGTDWLGRDVFSRVLHGTPITLAHRRSSHRDRHPYRRANRRNCRLFWRPGGNLNHADGRYFPLRTGAGLGDRSYCCVGTIAP